MTVARPLALFLTLAAALVTPARGARTVYPAPDGEPRSSLFTVAIDGHDAFVYPAKVSVADEAMRAKVVDDFKHFGDQHADAAFVAFDLDATAPADVVVMCPDDVRDAKVLPASANVTADLVDARHVRLHVTAASNLTLEINGDTVRSLHLFANPPERDVPSPTDANVIYFGPGVHEIAEPIDVPAGKTLYLAGGAVLRATSSRREPIVKLHGSKPALRGRGVIDAGACAIHSRNVVAVLDAQDATVEGVVLLDAPTFHLPVRRSDRVAIQDVKILGFRANSDGIDVCNSRDVSVHDCFVRTADDLVVVKTDAGQGDARRLDVRRCVLWNAFAHALSIGAELREPVSDVTFADCDVIHDVGREWTLRIFHCDDALIERVRFGDIRVAESRKLISLWIGEAVWSRAPARGHIEGVTFEHVACDGGPARIDLHGFDAEHAIRGVTFDQVTVAGHAIGEADVERNAFVSDVSVRP